MAASLAAAAAAVAASGAQRLCRAHHRHLVRLLALTQPPSAQQQHTGSLRVAAELAQAHSSGGGLLSTQQQIALLPSQWQRHCSTLVQQQQQPHQEQHPEAAAAVGVRAQARVSERQLALAVSAARAASEEAQPALLDAATSLMVQQLQAAGADPPPAQVTTGLLHLYEAHRRALPPAAAQSLLRHAARTAHQWRVVHILRLLRSVAYSRLHDKAAGGAARSAAQAWPSVLPLFQQLLAAAAPGSSEPFWGAVVPQLLRYASVMGAQLPQPMLGEFVQLWLDAVRSSSSSSSSSSSVGGDDDGDSSSGDSSKQATPASAASQLMRAVALLGQELPPQQMQQMLQLLLAADDDSTQQQQAAATAGAHSAACEPSDAVGAALTTIAWLPRLLEAAHCRHRASFTQEQRVRLLAMAGQSLRQLAVGGVDSGSSSSSSMGSPQPAHVASAIAALVRALSLAQRASPLSSTPGLVDRLAGVMTESQATARQLMTFTESLGKLHMPPSPERMGAIIAAVVAGLAGGQHDARRQRRQQQQPPHKARAVDIARFLWACGYMGYALQEPQLLPLLQQVAARLEPHRATFPVAQALWALAHMGAVPAPQQADGAGRGSPPATDTVSGLALALIQAALQEQQQGQRRARGGTGGGGSSAPEQHAAAGGPAPADDAGVRSDNTGRQLSIVCWGAAMCDLTTARDSVLQLCAVLAQPQVFATLHHHELVQLGLVHLWLSGDYLWSDTRGLAAVMSKQQLERIHAAKVLQGRRVTASKQGLVSQLLSQTATTQPAAPQQQQQDRQAKQPLLQLLQQRQHDAYMPGRSGSDSSADTTGGSSSSSSSSRRLQQAEREQRRLQQQWEDEERRGAGSPGAAGPDSQAADTFRAGPSNAQRRLYLAVSELPEIRAAQLEVLTHDSMFPVDVHAVTHAGRACVFEFDGPFHYTRLVPLPAQPPASAHVASGSGDLAVPVPGRRHRGAPSSVQHAWEAVATHQLREVAATHFRNKALAARGFVVVCVPYYDWCQMPSPRQRQEYIQRRLMAALQRQQQQPR